MASGSPANLSIKFGDRRPPEPLTTNAPPESEELSQIALDQRADLAQLRLEQDLATQFAQAQKALGNPTPSAFGTLGVTPVRDFRL